MNISNDTPFYKVTFSIEAAQRNGDPVSRVITLIRDWKEEGRKEIENVKPKKWEIEASKKEWAALRHGGRVSGKRDGGSSISITSSSFPARKEEAEAQEEYWACEVDEVVIACLDGERLADRHWKTSIGMVRKAADEPYRFSLALSYVDDVAGFIGGLQKYDVLTIPWIVRLILEDPCLRCTCGQGMNVPIEAEELRFCDAAPLWSRLKDPKRQMPYVLIQSLAGEDAIFPAVDPHELAKVLTGNACVFYSTDARFFSQLRSIMPPEYCLTDSMALRVFFPKLDSYDAADALRHRSMPNTADDVVLTLRRALALVPTKDEEPFFFDLRDCANRLRFAELKKENSALLKRAEELQRWKQEGRSFTDKEVEEMLDINLELEAKIDSLTSKLYEQDSQSFASAKQNQARSVLTQSKFANMPQGPAEVMDYFESLYGDRIVFLPGARKSARSCDLGAKELWEIFFHLAVTMRDIFVGGSKNPYKEFKNRVRGKMEAARGEGSTTRKNPELMRQYEAEYEGRSISIEPHITLPNKTNGQSVHFAYCPWKKVIAVGYCGKHTKTAGSQYVH